MSQRVGHLHQGTSKSSQTTGTPYKIKEFMKTSVVSYFTAIYIKSIANKLCKISIHISDLVCGQDESYDLKPWSIYVFALTNASVTQELKHIRRCMGTLINSNMVITSHKCLVQQLNQTINIYNAWINNFTLPLDRFIATRDYLPTQGYFLVKDIILNTRYAFNEVKGIFPGSDVAILILNDTDINILDTMAPVCLPEYDRDLNVIYQTGYFYGVGGLLEYDITVETRKATDVPILSGPECDEEMGGVYYHLESSNESFCIRYPALAPVCIYILQPILDLINPKAR